MIKMKFYRLRKAIMHLEQVVPNVSASAMPSNLYDVLRKIDQAPLERSSPIGFFQLVDLADYYADGDDEPMPDARDAEHFLHDFYQTREFVKMWLVSPRFKQLLEPFIISSPFRFYPTQLRFRDQFKDFLILKIYKDTFDTLLFEKSTFWKYNRRTHLREPFVGTPIPNKRAFFDAVRQLGNPYTLVTQNGIYAQYADLSFGIGGYLAVSERLKQAIEAEKISGVDFEVLDMEIRFLDKPNL
jgi:hypothetical protein